jgi:hypothetical protein
MFKLNGKEDLLYYHNKILNYIKIEKSKISKYEEECLLLSLDCYHSFDIYGILEGDKQFILSQISNNNNKNINCIKKLSYKDFKDYIKKIKKINSHIAFIQHQDMIYTITIIHLIENYKKIIQTPVKQSFIGKKKLEENEELVELINEFIYTIKQMFPEDIIQEIFKDMNEEGKKKKQENIFIKTDYIIYCEVCGIEITENICQNCGNVENETIDLDSSSTYDDTTRINVNKAFTYKKRCHFRDTINQFQGKQNKYIPEKVYEDLYKIIEKEGLIDKKKDDKQDKFRKLKKSHIREFLKASNHSIHFEDLQLIYSKITGKDCPCISNNEKQLYEDFDLLTEAFMKIVNLPGSKIKRDNFLNSHYVLRQLLLKQGVKVPPEDLNYLKTSTRLREHDDIYQQCCNILNWNFIPMA